ncbi:MAG: glycosyltransferase family 39 protein [Saprospiraceae bacterium]
MKRPPYRNIGITLFVLLCYFPLFLHLDALPLHLWDEARRGVNTIELLDNGHWFVPYFDGYPDMWGTKPPLLIWMQSFFAATLGVNELSIRLPSALAGAGTVALMIFFASRVLRRPLAGYFGGLVLLTTGIYIRHHGPVTGDYDALLTFWETGYFLCGYLYLSTGKNKWLYVLSGAILLAFWTKGVAGLFFIPGPAVAFLFTHRGRELLQRPRFWSITSLTLLGCLMYYFLRELFNPGYLAQIWNNELFGRFTEAKGTTYRSFTYYFVYIYRENGFFPWLYLLPLAFTLGWRSSRTRYISLLAVVTAALFFLVISLSATKLSWYAMPVFPLLALIVGIGLERLYTGLNTFLKIVPGGISAYFSLLLFGLAFFTFPYLETVTRLYRAGVDPTEQHSELYRDFIRQLPPEEKNFTILYDQYNATAVFYRIFFNRRGYDIQTSMLHPPGPELPMHPGIHSPPSFQSGDKVMVCEREAKTYLDKHYEWEALHYFHNCRMVEIRKSR